MFHVKQSGPPRFGLYYTGSWALYAASYVMLKLVMDHFAGRAWDGIGGALGWALLATLTAPLFTLADWVSFLRARRGYRRAAGGSEPVALQALSNRRPSAL